MSSPKRTVFLFKGSATANTTPVEAVKRNSKTWLRRERRKRAQRKAMEERDRIEIKKEEEVKETVEAQLANALADVQLTNTTDNAPAHDKAFLRRFAELKAMKSGNPTNYYKLVEHVFMPLPPSMTIADGIWAAHHAMERKHAKEVKTNLANIMRRMAEDEAFMYNLRFYQALCTLENRV
jgi:hypothetical protein